MARATDLPYGTAQVPGMSHRRSAHPVAETVEHLSNLMHSAGATVFAVIDQSAAATTAGQTLRDTTLIVFGSPTGGTPIMQAVPLSGMDLPLKILVWRDDQGQVWMTYLSAEWLADRYGLSEEVARPLHVPDTLTRRLATSD